MKDEPRSAQRKTRRLYQVSLGNGRITKRLYPYNRARKIAGRYNRLTGTSHAYAAGPLRVVLIVR